MVLKINHVSLLKWERVNKPPRIPSAAPDSQTVGTLRTEPSGRHRCDDYPVSMAGTHVQFP